VATANAVEYQKAKLVFVDIDLKTFNIDPEKIEEKITTMTKACIPVHLFGLSADMNRIMEIAQRYNLKVVEDSACTVGSLYQGKHVGRFGDIGCFSFHPRKTISTGEGGMVVTNNEELAVICKMKVDTRNSPTLIIFVQREFFEGGKTLMSKGCFPSNSSFPKLFIVKVFGKRGVYRGERTLFSKRVSLPYKILLLKQMIKSGGISELTQQFSVKKIKAY